MDAKKANQWLTLVANIGVVAGIIFLAIEIRQNTDSQNEFIRVAQANAYQARAFAASAKWSTFASSPEVVESMVAFNEAGGMNSASDALAAMSADDYQRMIYIALAQAAILDNNFYQYRLGYLDEDRYHSIDARNLQGIIPLFDALEITFPKAMLEEVERLRQQ